MSATADATAPIRILPASVSGLAIIWREPLAVLTWGVFLTVGSLLLTPLQTAIYRAFNKLAIALDAPVQQSGISLFSLLPGVALSPFVLAVFAISAAAYTRAVLNPKARRFGYLRLGADELRLFALFIILSVLGLFAVLIDLSLTGIVISMAMGFFHVEFTPDRSWLFRLLALTVTLPVVLLARRFVLAPAHTLATGRLDVMASWRLTRGVAWQVAITFALVFLVGEGLLWAVRYGLARLLVWPGLGSVSDLIRPAVWGTVLAGGFASAIAGVVMVAPGATIYLTRMQRVEEVF